MSSIDRKSCWSAACLAVAAVAVSAASAQSLDEILETQQQRTLVAQQSQERVNDIVDDARRAEERYNQVMKEIEGLEVYNQLLQRQVDNQVREKEDLRESLDEIDMNNRQIVPIMVRMLDSLEQFIELDIPFLQEERTRRVRELQRMMERQDVTVAEKFRRITEAFQIENDYGRTMESFSQTLEIDGREREVEILKIGRIAMIYQTADASRAGVWDQRNRRWVDLGTDYRTAIRLGLQMARGQLAPNLLILPVDAPEPL